MITYQATFYKTESNFENIQYDKRKKNLKGRTAALAYARKEKKRGKYFCVLIDNQDDYDDHDNTTVIYQQGRPKNFVEQV